MLIFLLPVHGNIRFADNVRYAVFGILCKNRDTEGSRHSPEFLILLAFQLLFHFLNGLGDLFFTCTYDQEFISAIAKGPAACILASLPDGMTDPLQKVVAFFMAIAVIGGFQTVDVNEGNCIIRLFFQLMIYFSSNAALFSNPVSASV